MLVGVAFAVLDCVIPHAVAPAAHVRVPVVAPAVISPACSCVHVTTPEDVVVQSPEIASHCSAVDDWAIGTLPDAQDIAAPVPPLAIEIGVGIDGTHVHAVPASFCWRI
jgi:hypothetical protein